jgi:hypothetical protein
MSNENTEISIVAPTNHQQQGRRFTWRRRFVAALVALATLPQAASAQTPERPQTTAAETAVRVLDDLAQVYGKIKAAGRTPVAAPANTQARAARPQAAAAPGQIALPAFPAWPAR